MAMIAAADSPRVGREVWGSAWTRCPMSRKKPAFSMWMPSSLGMLIDDDHRPDARLEAGKDRVGDEVGQEAEVERSRGHQDQADQDRERRGGGDELRGVRPGDDLGQGGTGQDGEGGGGADAQDSRASEQGVDDGRDQARIEADLDRESRDGGVGHRLGKHDRRGGQPGEEIGNERAPVVATKPAESERGARTGRRAHRSFPASSSLGATSL